MLSGGTPGGSIDCWSGRAGPAAWSGAHSWRETDWSERIFVNIVWLGYSSRQGSRLVQLVSHAHAGDVQNIEQADTSEQLSQW